MIKHVLVWCVLLQFAAGVVRNTQRQQSMLSHLKPLSFPLRGSQVLSVDFQILRSPILYFESLPTAYQTSFTVVAHSCLVLLETNYSKFQGFFVIVFSSIRSTWTLVVAPPLLILEWYCKYCTEICWWLGC